MKKLLMLLWMLLSVTMCFASEPNDYYEWNCMGSCANTPRRRIPIFNVFTASGCLKVRNEHKSESLIICRNPLIDQATIFYGDRTIMPNELNQVSREIYENSNEFKQKQIIYIQESKKQQVLVPVYWAVVLFLIVSAVYSGVTCWKRKSRVYKNWPDAAISMFLIIPSLFALYMLFNLSEIPSIQNRINAAIIVIVFLSVVMGYHIWRVKKLNPGRNPLILMLIISGRILYSVMIPFLALAATSEGKRDRPQSYSGGLIDLVVRGAVLYGLWAFTRRLMAKE